MAPYSEILRAATMLVDGGAAGVVLSSRSGRVTVDAHLASLLAVASIRVSTCDVSDAMDTLSLLDSFAVSGVLHAAGVLRDKLLRAMCDEDLLVSFAPKALAASRLHASTALVPLEALGLFSSASATFGTIGQGNYAAANAHLDGDRPLPQLELLPAPQLLGKLLAA